MTHTLDHNEIIDQLLLTKEKMNFSITIIKKLFDSFVTSSYDSANILLEAGRENNIQVVKEKAHAIRGGALTLNLDTIAKLCNTLEYDEEIDYINIAEELKIHIDALYNGKSETLAIMSTMDIT